MTTCGDEGNSVEISIWKRIIKLSAAFSRSVSLVSSIRRYNDVDACWTSVGGLCKNRNDREIKEHVEKRNGWTKMNCSTKFFKLYAVLCVVLTKILFKLRHVTGGSERGICNQI